MQFHIHPLNGRMLLICRRYLLTIMVDLPNQCNECFFILEILKEGLAKLSCLERLSLK